MRTSAEVRIDVFGGAVRNCRLLFSRGRRAIRVVSRFSLIVRGCFLFQKHGFAAVPADERDLLPTAFRPGAGFYKRVSEEHMPRRMFERAETAHPRSVEASSCEALRTCSDECNKDAP
jgi:hypothetical protein